MSVGTPFHPRTAPLNRKMQWREWSGYFASSVYADAHDIEYNAIREAAALIDVSPALQVHRVRARRAPARRPGHHPRRDEAARSAASSTRRGATSTARSSTTARSIASTSGATAGRRPTRSSAGSARTAAGLDVTIDDETEATAALALQGPLSRDVLEAATGESFADLRYFRRRASQVGKVAVDVSRTGYTGDLGYELWIPAERARSRSGTR